MKNCDRICNVVLLMFESDINIFARILSTPKDGESWNKLMDEIRFRKEYCEKEYEELRARVDENEGTDERS